MPNKRDKKFLIAFSTLIFVFCLSCHDKKTDAVDPYAEILEFSNLESRGISSFMNASGIFFEQVGGEANIPDLEADGTQTEFDQDVLPQLTQVDPNLTQYFTDLYNQISTPGYYMDPPQTPINTTPSNTQTNTTTTSSTSSGTVSTTTSPTTGSTSTSQTSTNPQTLMSARYLSIRPGIGGACGLVNGVLTSCSVREFVDLICFIRPGQTQGVCLSNIAVPGFNFPGINPQLTSSCGCTPDGKGGFRRPCRHCRGGICAARDKAGHGMCVPRGMGFKPCALDPNVQPPQKACILG